MRAIELTLHEINFKNTKSERKGGENSDTFFLSFLQVGGSIWMPLHSKVVGHNEQEKQVLQSQPLHHYWIPP